MSRGDGRCPPPDLAESGRWQVPPLDLAESGRRQVPPRDLAEHVRTVRMRARGDPGDPEAPASTPHSGSAGLNRTGADLGYASVFSYQF